MQPGYEHISEKIRKAEQIKLYKAKEIKEKKVLDAKKLITSLLNSDKSLKKKDKDEFMNEIFDIISESNSSTLTSHDYLTCKISLVIFIFSHLFILVLLCLFPIFFFLFIFIN